MKKTLLVVVSCFCFVTTNLWAQQTVAYDSITAKRTGADDYGMKLYVMAFLKKGKSPITDKNTRTELLMGHMKNMGRLAAEGKLVLAGPMTADSILSGVFVFNVKTIAEAQLLSETDPAVKAGLFDMEYHTWYATAALMEVVRIHASLEKKKRG